MIAHMNWKQYWSEQAAGRKTILSLFDFSGNWSKPYRDAGYQVIQIDIKLAMDVMTLDTDDLPEIHGVLAALPCTDFAVSGARWFKAKDADGRTAYSLMLLDRTLEIIDAVAPQWWAMENPVGRIARLRPELGGPVMYFQPCDFGEPYTKKTGLWGTFNTDMKRTPVEPTEGSKMWAKYGGKSERTKAARSLTPMGFSRAFFEANQ
jgi:hypothetical protein